MWSSLAWCWLLSCAAPDRLDHIRVHEEGSISDSREHISVRLLSGQEPGCSPGSTGECCELSHGLASASGTLLSAPTMLADVVCHFSAMPPLCSAVSSAAILPWKASPLHG